MSTPIRSARALELDDSDEAILEGAVVEHEPDADIAAGDLAWWLQLQEQAETRAALAAHGLL